MSGLSYRFLGNVMIRGLIQCERPLHIGGSYEEYEIGGMDNPIIREPKSKQPYVPASSLRGKMRSSLEWAEGLVQLNNDGEAPPHNSSGLIPNNGVLRICPVSLIFGSLAADRVTGKRLIGPTRLIIRDAYLTPQSLESLARFQRDRGLPMSEYKTENTIDRITAVANPRPMERTLRGTRFMLDMVYRVYSIPTLDSLQLIAETLQAKQRISSQMAEGCRYDDGQATIAYLGYVFSALRLVEDTYLGGGGSRGSGNVSFWFEPLPTIRTREHYIECTDEWGAEPHFDEKELQPLTSELRSDYLEHVATAFGLDSSQTQPDNLV